MSDSGIAALRQINLDWTVMLQGVWADAPGDVPSIHQDVRADFVSAIDSLALSPATSSPTGWVIVGDGGAGKTHLLGRFRAECARRKACFVLVDMTDVRDFWDTVLLGYFTSLQEVVGGRRPQYERLIAAFLGLLKFAEPTQAIINRLRAINPAKLRPAMDKVLGTLHRRWPAEVNLNGDVVRALVALNCDDYNIANVGSAWLQGEETDADAKKKLGMTRAREKSSNIVRGMSWLMSLNGPSVVALDQLDPIVTQLNLEHNGLESTPALAIINKIGAGLSELRDVTRRTLLVVSCVDRTWKSLKQYTPKQFTDRYNPPRILGPLNSRQSVGALLSERLGPEFQQASFNPPYPTWPFRDEFLQQVALDSPREILKKCQSHINECVRRGEVRELPPGWESSSTVPDSRFAELDARFTELRAAADTHALLDEQHEDDGLGELVRSALRCVVKEVRLPDEIDALVDENFTGGKAAKPLHARLRLVFPHENSREEHACFRALQKTNSVAFTSRLRSAITQAGIDKALKFRRLVILRKGSPPGGVATIKMIRQFEDFGGIWLDPSADDLKTLEALRLMETDPHPRFQDWLKSRQPASATQLIRQAIPEFFAYAEKGAVSQSKSTPATAPTPIPPSIPTSGPEATAVPPQTRSLLPTPPAAANLTLGRRLIGDNPVPLPTTLPVGALRKHGVVFAGAGSGKTVLLKRLIEEAALLGVPSIVIDCANDLTAIGERWPSAPAEWSAPDAGLAETFLATTERVIWTPGENSGNPIGLEPLPDLAALAGSPEELGEAVAMAVDALTPVIAIGAKAVVAKKRAILTNAFTFLARHGNCNLQSLSAVLRDFPDAAATKIAKEREISREMADTLFAQLTTNPLLHSQGPLIDPAVLFGAGGEKTRISLISFVGLATLEEQRQFLNQLAMALFSWIKKVPATAQLPLRGLLVIDEARDFVPSLQASACLGSVQRLASQARKYGLGLILATQSPKGIDNTIVAQCATQWYGKMNAPATIEAATELLRARGASAEDDVAGLKAGRFYVSNADYLSPPAKLLTPMCLSANDGALAPDSIVQKARACREKIGAVG
jgi:hypothetical protein